MSNDDKVSDDVVEDDNNLNNDISIEKTLKTDSYTLNAIKRYRAKNAEKMKEYNKEYHQKKKAEKHQANPYIKFTKTQLYDKLFEYENKISSLEAKLKALNVV